MGNLSLAGTLVFSEKKQAIKRGDYVRLITLFVPLGLLKDLDKLVSKNLYPNRAEAIRIAIKDLVENEASL